MPSARFTVGAGWRSVSAAAGNAVGVDPGTGGRGVIVDTASSV
jgi:hypothetical protein